MKLRITEYAPDLPPGSIYQRNGSSYVVGRDGRHKLIAAKPDPSDIGPQGPPGRDSTVPGPPGRDGISPEPPEPIAFNFRGKWKRQQYEINDVVTTDDDGSFVCIRPTKTEPPTKAWQALALHGRLIEREFHSRVVIKKQSGDGTSEPEKVTAVFNEDTPRGAPVCVSGSGGVDLASAIDKPGVLGLCSGSVVAGASSTWQPEGLLSGAWSEVTESGNPTLTPGAIYYLSETPGKISETAPTSGYIVIVGRATDSGAKLAIEISVPVKL